MGYYPQESLYKPYKYHGYTVRGTPNCPLTVVAAFTYQIYHCLRNNCLIPATNAQISLICLCMKTKHEKKCRVHIPTRKVDKVRQSNNTQKNHFATTWTEENI